MRRFFREFLAAQSGDIQAAETSYLARSIPSPHLLGHPLLLIHLHPILTLATLSSVLELRLRRLSVAILHSEVCHICTIGTDSMVHAQLADNSDLVAHECVCSIRCRTNCPNVLWYRVDRS